MVCKECDFQNKHLKGNAKYCTNCGSPLFEQKVEKKYSEKKRNAKHTRQRSFNNPSKGLKNFSIAKLWYGVAVIIGAFIIFSISESNSNSLNSNTENIAERKSENLLLEAKVFDIASKFTCACGGCNEDPLDKCKCDFAMEERKYIRINLENLNSDEETIEALNKKYGGLLKT